MSEERKIYPVSYPKKQVLEIVFDFKQRKFTLTDLQAKHQWINHWRKEGLLLTEPKEQGRTLYHFSEFMWLQIIIKLREFGTGFDLLRNLKADLFRPAAIASVFLGDSVESSSAIKIKEITSEADAIVTDFDIYLASAIKNREYVSFIINAKGDLFEVVDFKDDPIDPFETLTDYPTTSFIVLSFSELIDNFIGNPALEKVAKHVSIVSEDEREIIRLIRDGQLAELHVTNLDEEQTELVNESKGDISRILQRFIDIVIRDGYVDLSYTTKSGKEVRFETQKDYTRKIDLSID